MLVGSKAQMASGCLSRTRGRASRYLTASLAGMKVPPFPEDPHMQPTDLELFSTDELIDELLRRSTFLGVVVQSQHELKNNDWTRQKAFKVHYNSNLDAGEASRLLETVASSMQNSC